MAGANSSGVGGNDGMLREHAEEDEGNCGGGDSGSSDGGGDNGYGAAGMKNSRPVAFSQ